MFILCPSFIYAALIKTTITKIFLCIGKKFYQLCSGCNAINSFYRNITIDSERVQQLPQNGIPTGLLTMNNSNEDNVYEMGDNCMGDNYSHSFLPVPRGTPNSI